MAKDSHKPPLGIWLMAGFFCFGFTMCSLTLFLLLFPGTPLDVVWRVKPTAQGELAGLGPLAIPLMTIVGAACAGAAVGLARCNEWGRRLAIAVLVLNLIGDSLNAIFRADWHTLIGLPIGGLMIFYLMRSHTRRCFSR